MLEHLWSTPVLHEESPFTMDQLEELIHQVSTTLKREVQVLLKSGASPDHPVKISCRESAYLKCLAMRVIDKNS